MMRGLLIVAAGAAALIATPASAQHSGGASWHGHDGAAWQTRHAALGERAAYRQPMRGGVLPSYWAAPGWAVRDWAAYGLPAPPQGYHWSLYYDDAVLIDGAGRIWDSRGGLDWDAYDRGYDDGWRDAAEDGPDDGMGPPPPPPPPPPAGTRYGPAVTVTRGGVPVEGARVTTTCVGDCRGVVEDGWYYPPATETTITVPPCRCVTTTTTTRPAKTYVIERPVTKTVVVERTAPGKTVRKLRNTKTRKVIRK